MQSSVKGNLHPAGILEANKTNSVDVDEENNLSDGRLLDTREERLEAEGF